MISQTGPWNFSFDKEATKRHKKKRRIAMRRSQQRKSREGVGFDDRKKKIDIAKRRSQERKLSERIGLMNNTSFNTVKLMQCDGCYESFPVDKIFSSDYHHFCELCELNSTKSCMYCELPYDTTSFEDWHTPICGECNQDRIEEERKWYRHRQRFRRKRRKCDLF